MSTHLGLRGELKAVTGDVKTLADRSTGLEQAVVKMLEGINGRFKELDKRLKDLEMNAEAVVQLVGVKEVGDLITENFDKRLMAKSDKEKASLDQGIAQGYVLPADKVTMQSLIVGKFFNADGNVNPPGRSQFMLPKVDPQFQAQLLDKGVGTTLDLPNNCKFELTEIYFFDVEKARAVLTTQAAEAQAAQVAPVPVAETPLPAAEAPAPTSTDDSVVPAPAVQ